MNIVANFTITFTQFLDATGTLIAPLPEFAQDKKILTDLYRAMVLNRIFDTKAIALQRTGKIGTYPPSLGQEAVFAGLGMTMEKEDFFCPYYRDQGALLIRGVSMVELLQYWGGDERGSDYKNCPRDFPICVPIATQLLHAAGVASAIKIRQQPHVVVTTCGEGGTSEGDFYEAINIAGIWNLPLVFVVNNNQWAISVSREKQTAAKTLAQKAIAAGFEGKQVDGNDVIAVYDVVSKAVKKARMGKGPTLIEAISYRLSDHTTADDAKRYRFEEELKTAWTKDPLVRLKNYLLKENFWDAEAEAVWVKNCQQQVDTAVEDYLAIAPPSLESMFDYQYAHLPAELIDQKLTALAQAKLTRKESGS